MVSARQRVGKRKKMVFEKGDVLCPYCHGDAVLVDDSKVYSRSFGGRVWLCQPCRAWVGVHRDSKTNAPLGRLAKADLRALKVRAQVLFDRFWKAAIEHRGWAKHEARKAAYHWLAGEMGIRVKKCHIGYFDEEQTKQVIELCTNPVNRKEK